MADSGKKKASARQVGTAESPSKKAAKKAKVSKTTVSVFEPVSKSSFSVEIDDPKSPVMPALKQECKTVPVKPSTVTEKDNLSAMFASFSDQMRCMFSAELKSASAQLLSLHSGAEEASARARVKATPSATVTIADVHAEQDGSASSHRASSAGIDSFTKGTVTVPQGITRVHAWPVKVPATAQRSSQLPPGVGQEAVNRQASGWGVTLPVLALSTGDTKCMPGPYGVSVTTQRSQLPPWEQEAVNRQVAGRGVSLPMPALRTEDTQSSVWPVQDPLSAQRSTLPPGGAGSILKGGC